MVSMNKECRLIHKIFPKFEVCQNKLLDLLLLKCDNSDKLKENQKEFIYIINSIKSVNLREYIINKPINMYRKLCARQSNIQLVKMSIDIGDVTLLMMATYMLKYKVVKELLRLGANTYYINQFNDGLLTYWHMSYPLTHTEKMVVIKIGYYLKIVGIICGRTEGMPCTILAKIRSDCMIRNESYYFNLISLVKPLKKYNMMCSCIDIYIRNLFCHPNEKIDI